MTGRIVGLSAAMATFFAVATPARAADPAVPARLSADFVMERSLKALKDTIRSSGRMALGGPGLLRWEMTAPSRSTIVINHGRAWIAYPDLGVTKSFDLSSDPVMRILSEHMLVLTTGAFDRLADLYEVSELPGGARRLVPREAAVKQVFSEIRVNFAERGGVSLVEMVSPSGDVTRIRFSNVVLDPAFPESHFQGP